MDDNIRAQNVYVSGKNVNSKVESSIKDLFKLGEGETKLSLDRIQTNIDEGGASLKNAMVKAGAKLAADIVAGGIKFTQALREADAEIRKAEIEIEKWQNTFVNRLQKIDLETGFRKQLKFMDTFMKETENLTRASFKTLGEGITSGAWGSFNALIEYQTSMSKLNLELQYEDTRKYIEKAKLGLDNKEQLTTLENKLEQSRADKNLKMAQAAAGITKVVGDFASGLQHPVAEAIGGIVSFGAEVGMAGYELGYATEKIGRELENAEVNKSVSNIKEQLDNYSTVIENEFQMELKWLDFHKEMKKIYGEMAQTAEKQVMVFNDLATKTMNLYGYIGSQLEGMKGKDIASGIVSWATNAYLKVEDIVSAQLGYQRATGRNVHLGKRDVTAMGFVDMYAGENGITGKIAAQLQAFNVSVGDTATLIASRMASLEKSGLSSKKYVQDIEKYLNLANKYNFRNGVYGLSKMVEYAQRTKFNMDSLSGSLDKFSSTDISSVLEASARLNVLGGNAALYSDPLGMHYDATMDPDSFMRRMIAMTSEHGTFNKSTGMMQYGYVGTQIMKTIGEQLGYSVEDMRKQANEAEKRRQIESRMSGKGFSETQLDFLIANAYWDRLSGGWKASVGGNEMDISNLEKGDLDKIIPRNTEEQMMSITSNVDEMTKIIKNFMPIEEVSKRQEVYNQLHTVLKDYGTFMGELEKRVDNSFDVSRETYEKYGEDMLNYSKQATEDATKIMDKREEAIRALFSKGQPIDEINKNVKALKEHFVGKDVQNVVDAISDVNFSNFSKLNVNERGKVLNNERGYGLTENEEKAFNRALHNLVKEGKGRGIKDLNIYDFNDLWGEPTNAKEIKARQNIIDKIISRENEIETNRQMAQISEWANKPFIEDGFTSGSMFSISKRAKAVTSANDINMSWQKGGPLDTLFNGVAGKVSAIGDYVTGNGSGGGRNVNVNVTFGGRAELSCNGNRIDLGEVLMNDHFFMRTLTEEILKEVSKLFDGRGTVNSYVNLKNIFK